MVDCCGLAVYWSATELLENMQTDTVAWNGPASVSASRSTAANATSGPSSPATATARWRAPMGGVEADELVVAGGGESVPR